MSDQQLILAGPVASGEAFEASGIWLSVMQLVNTLDQRATLYLKGDTLPPGSPEWDTHARTIPAVIQQVEVPVPANGAIEAGVMIVPDPGSSLAVDYGHRIALPPPRDGELPTRAATQYATIRNTGESATTVSLIYTYQQETFNPGKGNFLGAEMGRVRLGVGEQFRLGGSLSGVIDGPPQRTLLEVDFTGARPAVLRDVSDEDPFERFDQEFLLPSVVLDNGIRIGGGTVSVGDLGIPDGREAGSLAQQVRYDEPTVGQTILTDRIGWDVRSTFTYRFHPIVAVDLFGDRDDSADAFQQGDLKLDLTPKWEYRGRERVGSELTDWADPDTFPTGDSRLRVGEFGRNLDWYYDTSWIPGLREELDEHKGFIRTFAGKAAVGAGVIVLSVGGFLLFTSGGEPAVVPISGPGDVTERSEILENQPSDLEETTSTLATTTTTLPLIRIDLFIVQGLASPLNLWDTAGPSRIGANNADPRNVNLAWRRGDIGVTSAILSVDRPVVGDFDGDGIDDVSTAAELFQAGLDPRNGGCGTPDGLSNAFLPGPISVLTFGSDASFGACDTLIDLAKGGTVFVYTRQPAEDGDPPLGDYAWDFEPPLSEGLEGYLLVNPVDGTGTMFFENDVPLVGDFAFDPGSPFLLDLP